MSSFTLLQNREVFGTHVVYAWPADRHEAFCDSEDQAFTDEAHRVIVAGTEHCALHGLREAPCPIAYRTPPLCTHERLDESAPPETPRCATCGAVGADESSRWLRNSMFSGSGAPVEALVGDEVALGQQGTPEESP